MLKRTQSATTGKSQQGLPSTLLPLLITIAGLVIAGVLLWLTLLGSGNTRYQADLSAAYGSQQQGSLDRLLEQIDADLTRLAANPQLQVAVQQGQNPIIDRSLRHTFAHSLAIYTHAPGRANVTDDPEAPVNFGSLDMIRRAERGLTVPVEAYRIGGAWRLYAVKPLRASPSAPIGGTLLVVYDLKRITSNLPPLPEGAGQIRLIQNFPTAAPQTLFQHGHGDGEVQQMPTSHPAWQLEFRPGPQLDGGLLNPLLLLAAAVIALLASVIALLALQSSWSRKLKADADTLCQLSEGHKAAGLELGPLEPAAQCIMNLARNSGRTVGPSPKREAAPATTEELQNPIFQSDDVLDIDIVEEDSDPFTNNDDSMDASAPSLPASIFRAYDIRGTVPEQLNADSMYWIGRAIGSATLDADEPNIVVGRDGRLSGPELVEALIQGLVDSGCQVTDLDMVPTPVVYFATHTSGSRSGVMLTGSHNPPNYNGVKIVIAGQTLYGEQITALLERLEQGKLSQGGGSRKSLQMLDAYREHIVDDIVLARPLKVVIDCGNGVTGIIAQQLLEEIGCEVIPLFTEVDGNFPNHHPDPGHIENLQELIATVKTEQADIGLAFDGDGDRVGVISNSGQLIYPDRLLMLLAEDILARNPGADIIFDVKCTRQLSTLISKQGGRPLMWKSGHSLIKAKMRETGALLAGEMSGHIFFKERWFGFDDGLYVACRLLELLALQDASSTELFSRYRSGLTTPELTLEVGDERKFTLIEQLRKGADWGDGRVSDVDGLRVDYPNGWGLVRASNTTPMLVLRFEASNTEELERLKQIFRDQMAKIAPDLPFIF
ncbi:phosphomannomutase [Halopseudomonas salegens]|uniref:phosphomannomutase n=2 Tax=Halopseudomonas salegens TaxID=1434072 RepID=A0A1H2HVA5_9GAMM|nr:phosphomannomutase [Halopseudomonas salegens]